jgi:hypothetical protein
MHVSGNTIVGSIYKEEPQMRVRAQKIADRTGKPVKLYSYTFKGTGRRTKTYFYEGAVQPAGSAKSNPLKIGKWIKAKIKKLRNGGYRIEVPGYGLPYGMRPKDR